MGELTLKLKRKTLRRNNPNSCGHIWNDWGEPGKNLLRCTLVRRRAMAVRHSTTVHEAVIRDLNLHLLFSINSKPAGDQKRVRINNTATFFSKFTPTTTKNHKFEVRSVSITNVRMSVSIFVFEFQFLQSICRNNTTAQVYQRLFLNTYVC